MAILDNIVAIRPLSIKSQNSILVYIYPPFLY